jgi:hypothetical protein
MLAGESYERSSRTRGGSLVAGRHTETRGGERPPVDFIDRGERWRKPTRLVWRELGNAPLIDVPMTGALAGDAPISIPSNHLARSGEGPVRWDEAARPVANQPTMPPGSDGAAGRGWRRTLRRCADLG